MKRFFALFKKVNGMKVLKEYANSGVLFLALTLTVVLGFSKKALEIVRNACTLRIYKKLYKKYKGQIENYNPTETNMESSNIVWVCWFQGIENAPPLVKLCYASICKHLSDKQIILITEQNYKEYTNFPSYILEKYEAGIITKTHFSDLLRIELLATHGGTWIDATVFCSEPCVQHGFMLNSELFFFQILKPGLDGNPLAVSSWFLSAKSANPIILLTRDLLFSYWKTYNRLLDYFLLHMFFQMALEKYPEIHANVVPVDSSLPHILLLRMYEPFNQNIWEATKNSTPFHKLSYKNMQEITEQSYYHQILEKESIGVACD